MRVQIAAVLMVAVFLFPGVVLAQDSTRTPRRTLQPTDKSGLELKKNGDARAVALKARLQAFKDKKKAEITERVSNNLSKINKNRTDHFLKFLDKAAGVLNKLETRVNGTVGKDTTSAKAAIADARVALASAKAAVQAQAAKDYTITVSSETKVRSDVTSVRDRLHQDLQAIRKQVVDAKQSVANAIKVASTSLGGNKNGTK